MRTYEESRPSPDTLLKVAHAEEIEKGRAKLKIFLGYAAGVGKTYAMLEAARQRLRDGQDVMVACVESHGSSATESLLKGLEVIPKASLDSMGMRFAEMDLDAVLARKPQIAVVDELSHCNAIGSRHEKRWQDVEELLASGIDVYTTVNIQHFESMNDVVAQITGVIVSETVPDRLLDLAVEIRLVDIPTEDLLQRLHEGKIYIPEKEALTIDQFFKPGNLMALRELSLRRAAARVDDQMRAYMESRSIQGPWPVAEKLLVCVSGSPYSERLIRTTRRLADDMKATWHTVHIETPGANRQASENRERVWRDLRLAESLGAQVATLSSTSVAEALIGYAVKNNVTKIVVGKPTKPRWREFLSQPLVDRIHRRAGGEHFRRAEKISQKRLSPRHIDPQIGISEEPHPGTGDLAYLRACTQIPGPHKSGDDLSPCCGFRRDPAGTPAGGTHRVSERGRLRLLFRAAPLHLRGIGP
jgi:two-component system sensor histidine kinase KdpD